MEDDLKKITFLFIICLIEYFAIHTLNLSFLSCWIKNLSMKRTLDLTIFRYRQFFYLSLVYLSPKQLTFQMYSYLSILLHLDVINEEDLNIQNSEIMFLYFLNLAYWVLSCSHFKFEFSTFFI